MRTLLAALLASSGLTLAASAAAPTDLGNLSANRLGPDSTSNPLGAGSPLRHDSPNNPLGQGWKIEGEEGGGGAAVLVQARFVVEPWAVRSLRGCNARRVVSLSTILRSCRCESSRRSQMS